MFAGDLNDPIGLDVFVKRHKLPAISNFTQDTYAPPLLKKVVCQLMIDGD